MAPARARLTRYRVLQSAIAMADRDGIEAVTRMFAERNAAGTAHPVPADYTITNTSERVVSLILGTARLSNSWDGIRVHDVD